MLLPHDKTGKMLRFRNIIDNILQLPNDIVKTGPIKKQIGQNKKPDAKK